MYSVQCTVCNVQCAMYRVQCLVCSVRCAVKSVQCAVCSVQCHVYNKHCSVWSIYYAFCSVHIKAPCSLATISLSQLNFSANMFCILCFVFNAALLLTIFPSYGLFEKASKEGTQVIGDFSISDT